jgi:hypothetical protein
LVVTISTGCDASEWNDVSVAISVCIGHTFCGRVFSRCPRISEWVVVVAITLTRSVSIAVIVKWSDERVCIVTVSVHTGIPITILIESGFEEITSR